LAQKVAAGHLSSSFLARGLGGTIDGAVHTSAFTDPRSSRRNAIGACGQRACNQSRAGISAASRSEKNRQGQGHVPGHGLGLYAKIQHASLQAVLKR
jgi:hypothetical protein